MSPPLPDYDRSETVHEVMRREGWTRGEYRRRMRAQKGQQRADNEQIAKEERERLVAESFRLVFGADDE